MDENSDRRQGAQPLQRRTSDQDAVAQNIAALASVVEATARNVQALSDEVRELRKTIVPRDDIRRQTEILRHQRRRAFVSVALFSVALIWAHDEHIEYCGPGVRLQGGVQALVDGGTREEIVQGIKGNETPKLCDVAFPLHDHDGNGYPGQYNLAGLGLWFAGVAGAVGFVVASRPKRED